MSEKTKELTIQDIIKWCDEQTEQGFELKLCWEGGGDSGWCWFELDGEKSSQPEAEWLIEKMYATLDYGSWAGEFSTSGEAEYNPETKEFDGTDYFSTEDTFVHTCSKPFTIKIPKTIHFDTLHMECEGEDYSFNINASVTNGFFSKESEAYFDKIETEINAWSEDVLAEINREIGDDQEITSAYQDYDFDKSDFTEEGDFLVHVFSNYQYRAYQNEPNGVNINLLDLLEDETVD
jgi:hypothetical protein